MYIFNFSCMKSKNQLIERSLRTVGLIIFSLIFSQASITPVIASTINSQEKEQEIFTQQMGQDLDINYEGLTPLIPQGINKQNQNIEGLDFEFSGLNESLNDRKLSAYSFTANPAQDDALLLTQKGRILVKDESEREAVDQIEGLDVLDGIVENSPSDLRELVSESAENKSIEIVSSNPTQSVEVLSINNQSNDRSETVSEDLGVFWSGLSIVADQANLSASAVKGGGKK